MLSSACSTAAKWREPGAAGRSGWFVSLKVFFPEKKDFDIMFFVFEVVFLLNKGLNNKNKIKELGSEEGFFG